MLENIQITNKNGDAITVEPICYLQVKSTGKKYLLYTLNEKVDNDLTKIYVAQVADGVEAQPIEQSEWDNLRKTMSKMSKKETVEDVEYLNMSGVNFVVGEAKKLGIPILLKQVFKDEAAAKTIANVQNSDTPVGMFIDPNLVAEPVTEQVIDNSAQSIFTNPPKPVETNMVSGPEISNQPVQSGIPVQEQSAFEEPVIPVTPMQPTPEPVNVQTVVESQTQPQVVPQEVVPQQVVSQPVQPVVTQSNEQIVVTPAVETPTVEASVVETNNQVIVTNEIQLITDDEALQAIDLLQKYIEQENKR